MSNEEIYEIKVFQKAFMEKFISDEDELGKININNRNGRNETNISKRNSKNNGRRNGKSGLNYLLY